MEKKYCIFGAGGFGREVLCCLIDSLPGLNIGKDVCFMVSDDSTAEGEINGVKVIPFSSFHPEKHQILIAVGDPQARKKIVSAFPAETTYASIIHPSVVISKWVEIGEGSIITAGSILTCNIRLGRHTHLNLHTTIGHDCSTGDFFTTAPGANISGNCEFGDCDYIGTNASLRQGLSICSNVTIGMGAVVLKSISEQGTYIGNPLKKLEK